MLCMWRTLEMATSPLSIRRPKSEQNGYMTPAFSGYPTTLHGDQIKEGKTMHNAYITLAFLGVLGAQHMGEITYGYFTPHFSSGGGGGLRRLGAVFKHPLPPRRLTAANGEKLKNGYCTPAFSGAQS